MNNLFYFLKLPFLKKLNAINKKTGINLFPIYIKKNMYSKILFFFHSLGKLYDLYIYNHNRIFKTHFDYEKLKIICSQPRSGTNFIYNVLSSYLEQLYNVGNGVPKAMGLEAEEMQIQYNVKLRNFNLIFEEDLFHKPRPEKLKKIDYNYFYHCHHPLQIARLVNFNLARPVILIRNPLEVISGYVLIFINHRIRNKKITVHNIDEFKELFLNKIDSITKVYEYWYKFIKKRNENNDKSYLLIKYEELIKNTEENLLKILKFYNIKINYDFLKNSININSKKNYPKLFIDQSFYIQTIDRQLEIKDLIKKKYYEHIKQKSHRFKFFYDI